MICPRRDGPFLFDSWRQLICLVVDKPRQSRVRLIVGVNELSVFSLLNFHDLVKVGDLSCSPRAPKTQ